MEAVAVLESYLKKGNLRFTLNEAAAMSGLSVDQVGDALDNLMLTYETRLQVSDQGDLIVDFGKKLIRRYRKTLRDRLRKVVRLLWRGFQWLFKGWIAITLVVYFAVFMLILLALILGAAGGRDNKGKGGFGKGGSSMGSLDIAGILHSIFRWRTHTGTIRTSEDRQGYPHREYRPNPGTIRPQEDRKGFIAAVYDFVFGPQRVDPPSLANQREVAAFLQKEKGLVVTADLQALAGWTAGEADSFFTECLSRFRGEVNVSENGVVYGVFDELLRGTGEAEQGKIEYFWDEYEPPYLLNGNGWGQNLLAMAFNGVNLVFSLLVLSQSLPVIYSPFGDPYPVIDPADPTIIAVLGWIPLIFSILFFAIPLFRLPGIRRREKKRRENNLRQRLFKPVFAGKGACMSLEDWVIMANRQTPGPPLQPHKVRKIAEELMLDLAGESEAGEEGTLKYCFPRIRLELESVPDLRQQRRLPGDLGNIVLDSE